MERYPTVSVVVPVRNRQSDIHDCLESILGLDYPSFETITVEDGSTDKTREKISQYPVKLVEGDRLGAYAARNKGIQAARGEIVAFTDSDCVVDRCWLKNLAECYYDDRIGGVGGQVLPHDSNQIIARFMGLGPQEIFDSPKRVRLGTPNSSRFLSTGLGSGNMSFRRSVLNAVKGFSEDMVKCGDYELCWRVQKAGYQLIFEPKAIVYHKPRSTLSDLVMQFFRFGMSQPELLKKQGDGYSYFELKSYLFPIRSFRCILPIQMLVTIDVFNLATLCLILTPLFPQMLYLFAVSSLMFAWYAMKKWKEALDKTRNMKLVLAFPFLHVIRS